jgi:hypothetical protein
VRGAGCVRGAVRGCGVGWGVLLGGEDVGKGGLLCRLRTWKVPGVVVLRYMV